jgi:uncharacterized protein (DUF1697 family)
MIQWTKNGNGDYPMQVYIALLRGINVGGHKLIKMVELKKMFEDMGIERVQTYIQSGNVLFVSNKKAESLSQQIEDKIAEVFDFSVTVVIRTLAQFEQIVKSCPFEADAASKVEKVYIALLAHKPKQEDVEALLACKSEVDDYSFIPNEVHILCRQSIRKSLFSNNFLEKKLNVRATTRNWQTMNKLVELGKAMLA